MTGAGWSFDHAAMTVPNLDEAVAFFTAVVGASVLYRRDIVPGSAREDMQHKYRAHPEAGFRLAKLDIAGTPVELFEYSAPDQQTRLPRNCDVGGTHWGFLVDDIDAAVIALREYPGVTVIGTVSQLPHDHPLAGRRWIYFTTPWGHQLELVCDGGR